MSIMSKPFVVACIPACYEERSMGVILRAMRFVDRTVVCEDGSSDLTSKIGETACFYVSRSMSRCGEGYVRKG